MYANLRHSTRFPEPPPLTQRCGWTKAMTSPLGFRAGDTNLYRYVRNDPVNRVDPSGLWEEGGHFYTTYYVARATGKISHDDALALAHFSWVPDQVTHYLAKDVAVEAAKEKFWQVVGEAQQAWDDPLGERFRDLQWMQGGASSKPWRDWIQGNIHALTGGEVAPYREALREMYKSNEFSTWEMGFIIHALGDSYSHVNPRRSFERNGELVEMLHSRPLGHALRGHGPDLIGRNRDRYERYVLDLFALLGGEDPDDNEAIKQLLKLSHELVNIADDYQRVERQRMRALVVGRWPEFAAADYWPEHHEALDIGRQPIPGIDPIPDIPEVTKFLGKMDRYFSGRP